MVRSTMALFFSLHSQLILLRAFAQRARTAFRASSERRLAGIFSQPRFSARFRPPLRPNVTAAGFLGFATRKRYHARAQNSISYTLALAYWAGVEWKSRENPQTAPERFRLGRCDIGCHQPMQELRFCSGCTRAEKEKGRRMAARNPELTSLWTPSR